MHLIDGQPVFAATDLVGFLHCAHLTNLERARLAGLVRRPAVDEEDPELQLIRKRGYEHERRFRDDLTLAGRTVTGIVTDGSATDQGAALRSAAAETRAAMERGADVIYQATFFDGRWRGHADFLLRIDAPSALGAWSYEVADTKLARTARAGALLQMCSYTESLTAIQGTEPRWMHVALGGSARAVERYRVADCMAYYRRVKARFEAAAAAEGGARFPPLTTYPEPVDHCEVCRWAPLCVPQRRRDDHLSLVAWITRKQRRGLEARGVATVEQLARLPLPVVPPLEGTSRAAVERVREQARLQVEARREDRAKFELLEPFEAGRGLALLPPPSAGDLFFDMEGDPFVEEGGADGLEYLFGIIEPGDGLGLDPPFHAFWAHDRGEEKQAFERFIDLVMERLARDPELHVYHYGAYEPSAVKRLMGRHATREEEVDRLLRGGVFVDLYSVVRQGVRISEERYSIKNLERLTGLVRDVSLRDAGSSILNFELWLDRGRTDQELLDLIERYNRDDCLSNWKLRAWLEERRAEVERRVGASLPRPTLEDGSAPATVAANQAEVEALVARLTDGLPPLAEGRSAEQQATWLLAQLLDWHRREDKAYWWAYFARRAMTDEELIEDDGALGGLTYEGVVAEVKQSLVHRYRFPPQENDIREGSRVEDVRSGKSPGDIVDIDQVAGYVDLKRSRKSEVGHPEAIIPADHFRTDAQREALMALGGWVAENGIDAPGGWRAARDLLLRRAPRAGQAAGDPLVHPAESTLDAARRLAAALDATYLPIQGPPGAGKTYTGARMILELVRAGKRVGITATSHKVIGKLLEEVYAAAAEAGVAVTAMQKAADDQRCSVEAVLCTDDNRELLAALTSRKVAVGAGTAWVWARAGFAESVDVLFVDEAGQISLANVLAISRAAKTVVLLGDPQQLEQPLQGSHPPGAEASALEHVLGGAQTITGERGLFLARTWRLHPDICAFTSEVFYESRLEPEEHLARQALLGAGELSGTGLRWIPVEHEGNQNESKEEAERVAGVCRGLIGSLWTDQGGVTRPIEWSDILVVAPYNAQVAAIAELLPPGTARVGTVDKFQGQEAAVAVYSMTTSSPDLAPRGMEFLYSLNRLNVATSRARALAVIVASPALLSVECKTPRQVRLANALCRAVEVAEDGAMAPRRSPTLAASAGWRGRA